MDNKDFYFTINSVRQPSTETATENRENGETL